MKEHPILFNGEMVRAILDGRKTQTRRVIKGRPNKIFWNSVVYNGYGGWTDEHGTPFRCPYGVPEDNLWVRETWAPHADDESEKVKRPLIFYRADGDDRRGNPHINRWRPSIYMPRWASRITLGIIDIRAGRLQDISDLDALAEGIYWDDCCPPEVSNGYCPGAFDRPSESFAYLWDSINAKRGYGWDTNPWVWTVEFKRF